PDEPVDAGRWRDAELAGEPASLARQPRGAEAGGTHAGDEAFGRGTERLDRVSVDPAVMKTDAMSVLVETVTPGQEAERPRPWLAVLHDWVVTVDHKRLGILYVVTGLGFLVVG